MMDIIICTQRALATIIVAIALLFVFVPAVSAGEREGTTARVFIQVANHPPSPQELKRRDILATARLRVLSDGSIGYVTFDRSSGYPKLDDAVAKAFKRWKVPHSQPYDTIIVPITFTLQSPEEAGRDGATKQK